MVFQGSVWNSIPRWLFSTCLILSSYLSIPKEGITGQRGNSLSPFCTLHLYVTHWAENYLRLGVVWFKVDIVHVLLRLQSWCSQEQQKQLASYAGEQISIKLSRHRKSVISLQNIIQAQLVFSWLWQGCSDSLLVNDAFYYQRRPWYHYIQIC